MPSVLIYLGRLVKKWMEMVTGGLIAVYLAIQPYTGWAAPHKWIFWSVIAAAWAIASYRVWLDSYRVVEQQRALIAKAGLRKLRDSACSQRGNQGPVPQKEACS